MKLTRDQIKLLIDMLTPRIENNRGMIQHKWPGFEDLRRLQVKLESVQDVLERMLLAE